MKPFSIEEYQAQRNIEVVLPSCGMVATVRPVTLVEVLNTVALHPGAVKQAKEHDALKKHKAEVKQEVSPEEAIALFSDLYDLTCAIAITACVSPPLTQQRGEPGKLFVYDLSDEDLRAIITPPLALLGLTEEMLAKASPFSESADAGGAVPEVGQAAE